MKKSLLVCLCLLLINRLFAAGVTLEANNSDNFKVDTHGSEVFQTAYTNSGVSITVGAAVQGSNIRYDVEIKNPTKQKFYFDARSMKIYEGNKDTGKWMKLKTQNTPATESISDDMTIEDGIIAAMLVGTVLVGTVVLFDWIFGKDDAPEPDFNWDPPKKHDSRPSREYRPRRHVHEHHYYHDHDDIIDDILFWSFVDSHTDSTQIDYSKNTLYSKTIKSGDMLYGSIFVPNGNQPDYKFCYDLGNGEVIEMIFSKPDRNSSVYAPIFGNTSSAAKSEPLISRKDDKVAVLGSFDFMERGGGGTFGGYVMYLSNPFGGYFGGNFGFPGIDMQKCDGYAFDHNFDDVIINNKSNNGTQYKFVKNDNFSFQREFINVTGGLTAKLAPCTWLVAGCGVDVSLNANYGEFYYKDRNETENNYTFYKSGYLYDKTPMFLFVPEVGLNFSFSIFDVGALFRYTTTVGPEARFLCGISF